ncbi:MAG: GNAT family N-acetyltransferase [Chloroflexi bacterium]|nr:MAG: GNAT family N-acetyltransferase [Chloroflexota bacterium]
MPDTRLEIAHTSALATDTLVAIRQLLNAAFEGDFNDDDWEHGLGGMHALVWDGDELIGHGSVVQRRMLHAGRSLRCGYVEAVAVHPDHQRRGHGAMLMGALEQIIRDAYELGALSSSEAAVDFYLARSWEQWRGPTSAFTPHGIERTEDEDDSTYILRTSTPLDLRGSLTCDWREGDVW